MKKELLIIKKSLLLMLMAVVALTFTACGTQDTTDTVDEVQEEVMDVEDIVADTEDRIFDMGAGETSFSFKVTFEDGTAYEYVVYTDTETVGEALVENGMIAGDVGDYGLYVTSVMGTELMSETANQFWEFQINGEMAPTGVDSTEIDEDAVYSFVVSEF